MSRSKKFLSLTGLLAGAVSVSAFGVAAEAAESVSINPHESNAIRVFRGNVADPSATVSRELSEQPVRPWLAQVKVVTQIVHIDPQANYFTQDDTEGRLDENHWIPRSQRLANALNAPTIEVYQGNPAPEMASTGQPIMILVKPPVLQRQKVEPKPIELSPTKPANPKTPKLVASSEMTK